MDSLRVWCGCLLLLGMLVAHAAWAVEPVAAGSAEAVADAAQAQRLLDTLQDPEQLEQLKATLQTLIEATETAEGDDAVRTAAADLVAILAERVARLSASATMLLETVAQLPQLLQGWLDGLRKAELRQRWLLIGGRLLVVLGAGFIAASLVAWATRRLRQRRGPTVRLSLPGRVWRLSADLVIDLLPVVVFALVAYALLTIVDPLAQTRLVAVALINASILSRLVLVVASFLLAPDTPQLRLWSIADETAHYLHHWLKRLSVIGIYGFFGLQAALLLGLDMASYLTLLRLLGLLMLGLLLVLVAQNRQPVAHVIAAERGAADTVAPDRFVALRRGLAQIWHLLAGLYLVAAYVIWLLQIEDGAALLLRATVLSLMIFAFARLLMHGIERAMDHGMRLPSDVRIQFPGLDRRLNRYFPLLRRALKFVVGAAAVLLLASAWGIDTLQWATVGTGKALLGALLNIVLIVIVAVFLWELTSGSIERYLADTDAQGNLLARSARVRTLLTVARNALLVVLAVVATLMVLSELGINIAPLLAGAGVVGLAIGFGSQRLVQDVINGAFILFQDLMSVGDVVKLGDKAGVVEALSIRTVRLRDLSGTVHTIPFSAIEGVSNLTRDFSFHVFDLGIAYRENVDEVITLITQIGEELRADAVVGPLILEPLEVFGLDAFGDSAITIKGRIKTQPIKQWQVGRAFNRLVKQRFDEHGIEIPFPHRTLYFGQDKDGAAPPAHVQLAQLEAMLREGSVLPGQAAHRPD